MDGSALGCSAGIGIGGFWFVVWAGFERDCEGVG